MRYGIVIPHDVTIVISALIDAGGACDETVLEKQVASRLVCSYAACGRYLLDKGLAINQLNEAGDAYSIIALTNPHKYKSNTVDKASALRVLHEAVDQRNFNSAYQAVVAGKTARADPLQRFVAKMSPIDQSDFWKGFMQLNEAQQDAYRTRVARLAYRSR
jgi:hydrogenase maturation factor